MANIKVQKMNSSSDFVYGLGLKDGSLIQIPWLQALTLKGRVFHAFVGNASTPVTLDASYGATDPDISLDVPDGTAIIPLCIRVVVEAYGSTALWETETLCTKTLGASSAGTAFTPINMATRSGGGSHCAVFVGPTVTDGTATAGAFELFRCTQSKAVTIATAIDTSTWQPEKFEWSIATAGFAPVLMGEASMQTWVTSQACTGYIQYFWAELDKSEVTY